MTPVKKISYSLFRVIACTLAILAVGQTAFPALGDEDLFNDLTATPSSAVSRGATPSSAAHPKASSSDVEEPASITRIAVSDAETGSLCLLKRGTPSSSLSFHLDCNSVAFYRKNGRFPERNVQFSVIYHTDEFDATYQDQTGLVFLNASIILEDDRYELSPEAETEISLPVFLYDPDRPAALPKLPPQTAQMSRISILAPVHSELKQVEEELCWLRPEFFLEFTDDGYSLAVPSLWDLSSVDMDTPGIYTVYKTPDLPQGVLLDDMPRETVPVNIQDPEAFTLSAPTERHSKMMIRWLYPTPEKSLFRRWYRVNGGAWTEDTSDTLMTLSTYDNRLSLFINPYELDPDPVYQFQLEYDGVYSDVLEIRMQGSGFSYSKHEGDRDGGDRDNQTPPDVTQPPPGRPQMPPDEGAQTPPEGESQAQPGKPQTPPGGESQAPPETDQPPVGEISTPPETDQSYDGDDGASGGDDGATADTSHSSVTRPGRPEASGGSEIMSPVITVPDQTASAGPGVPAQTGGQAGATSDAPAQTGGQAGATSAAPAQNDSQAGATPESPEAARAGFSYNPVPSDKEVSDEDMPAVAAGMEADTAHMTIWSGARILKYLEASPSLPLVFEKHRIRLEIPSSAPVLTSVTPGDFLRVEIEAISDSSVRLGLALNEVPLSELPLTVTMPWTKSSGAAAFRVKNEAGTYLEDADCSLNGSLLTFHVNQPGTYTVEEMDAAAAASDQAVAKSDEQTGGSTNAKADATAQIPADAPGIPPALAAVLAVLTAGVIIAACRTYRKRRKRH